MARASGTLLFWLHQKNKNLNCSFIGIAFPAERTASLNMERYEAMKRDFR